MRDYGKISAQFWIGKTGKALRGDPEAQVLALYLITSPHSTMTGVYHCPILYMAHETGLSTEGASKALARLFEAGFCEYDEASESVFVLRMAAHQVGDDLKPGDKRVIGLKKQVESMPSPLKERFIEVYSEAFFLGIEPGKRSPSEAPSKPLRSQEQEQEQEQKKESCAEPGSTLPGRPKPESRKPPAAPPPGAVALMPLLDGSDFAVLPADVAEWSAAYPAVNVPAELLKARLWLIDRPTRRKTRAGIRRYVSHWLEKVQNAGGGSGRSANPAKPEKDRFEGAI